MFSRIGRQRLSDSEGEPETEGVWGAKPEANEVSASRPLRRGEDEARRLEEGERRVGMPLLRNGHKRFAKFKNLLVTARRILISSKLKN